MIAVWNYVRPAVPTQVVNGVVVPNLLIPQPKAYMIASPPSPSGRRGPEAGGGSGSRSPSRSHSAAASHVPYEHSSDEGSSPSWPEGELFSPTPPVDEEEVLADAIHSLMAEGFIEPVGEPLPYGPQTPRRNRQPRRSRTASPAPPEDHMYVDAPTYHVQTRLADGRPALLIDPGSVGNLCGDGWAKMVAQAAIQNGQQPVYEKRPRPLQVQGVGHGAQSCTHDVKLPIALKKSNGKGTAISAGIITAPSVSNSELPGLLGLTALRKNRAVLDFNTLELYFLGPGDYTLENATPPGTDKFQCELAPSGHLVLPCCEYQHSTISTDHSLTLVTDTAVTPPRPDHVPPPPAWSPQLPASVTYQ